MLVSIGTIFEIIWVLKALFILYNTKFKGINNKTFYHSRHISKR